MNFVSNQARLAALLLAAGITLSGCGKEAEGEPVMRTEIGSGKVERIAPAPAPDAEESKPAQAKVDSDCQPASFEGAQFIHCIADPAKHRITTVWKGKDGKAYRSLRAYANALGTRSKTIAFAVNAGMFDKEGKPIGYYVEKKDRKVELNRKDGPGNFHMKPNGVFYGTGGRWSVKNSDSFYSTVRDRPAFGSQSGPMLVSGGKLHPEIAENGPSKAVRNAVGVDGAGKAHFVMSETPVSFGVIARFFKDRLKTSNALYLDGNVSALWDPARERVDVGAPIGPILVVTKREGG